MTERIRQQFDEHARLLAEMRKDGCGPRRDETAEEVAARLERQVNAQLLVDTIAEYLRKPGRSYDDPLDHARQIATGVLAEFEIRRRAQ